MREMLDTEIPTGDNKYNFLAKNYFDRKTTGVDRSLSTLRSAGGFS